MLTAGHVHEALTCWWLPAAVPVPSQWHMQRETVAGGVYPLTKAHAEGDALLEGPVPSQGPMQRMRSCWKGLSQICCFTARRAALGHSMAPLTGMCLPVLCTQLAGA